MGTAKLLTRSKTVTAGVALGVVAAAFTGATAGFAVAATMTPSATQGPSGGGNTITATVPTPTFFAGAVNVEFQVSTLTGSTWSACSANYATAAAVTATAGVVVVPSTGVKLLSNSKLSITVPSTIALVGSAASAKYNICVYPGTSTTTSALSANTSYTIAAKPTIATNGISPARGPAQGGQTITVTGTNFPTGALGTPPSLTATLGGNPLAVTLVSSTQFTAVTPPHLATTGPVLLTVTTAGGTVQTTTGTTRANLYTYTNGITVSPNTAPNTITSPTDVDVTGVGFSAMDFITTTGATPDDSNAHVLLVPGVYDPSTANNTGAIKRNGEVQECANSLVISDTEVVCSIPTNFALGNAGAVVQASRVVADGVTHSDTSLVSATAAFNSTDVGLAVSGTGITAGTTIASVTDATHAVLSAVTTATGTSVSVTIGARTVTDAVTAGSTTVTSVTANFASASDVGRSVVGTGIPLGATIVSVTDASTIVISSAATTTATGVTISIGNAVAVPVGTYTMTVVSNGNPDVGAGRNHADPNFVRTVVASTSTFTISDY